MELNRVERAIKTEIYEIYANIRNIRHGQARLVYVKDIVTSPPREGEPAGTLGPESLLQ